MIFQPPDSSKYQFGNTGNFTIRIHFCCVAILQPGFIFPAAKFTTRIYFSASTFISALFTLITGIPSQFIDIPSQFTNIPSQFIAPSTNYATRYFICLLINAKGMYNKTMSTNSTWKHKNRRLATKKVAFSPHTCLYSLLFSHYFLNLLQCTLIADFRTHFHLLNSKNTVYKDEMRPDCSLGVLLAA